MRAVVYKKPFEVAVGEGPGPQAGHPDGVVFRAPSAVDQAKDQLSDEAPTRALALSAITLSLTEASDIARGKTKKWPQSLRSSNEARLSRQLGEARRPSRSGGNANGYRFYA